MRMCLEEVSTKWLTRLPMLILDRSLMMVSPGSLLTIRSWYSGRILHGNMVHGYSSNAICVRNISEKEVFVLSGMSGSID